MKEDSITDPFYLQIQKEIDRIERKADQYIWMFYVIRITQIIFTGIITILAGISKIEDLSQAKTILILGAVTTAVTAFDTLFQVDNKKNTYKLVLFELRAIRAEIVYEIIKEGKIDHEFKAAFLGKYQKATSYARDLISTDIDKAKQVKK
ncbi:MULTISPECIES: SLATT domain-containing protein [unclassified Chryseobacterium]|uniref:SLATT domain-containing protein n=1 Tax=unclassified Chryseobacterium TaxID=2593645 RepID=UPI000647B32D|nr:MULTISPECIES: SLATT domain-containing protein [unclassified Chryseobacterium]SHF56919.1 Protein of unknown function [Chryseobacterium sp. OV279]HCA06359.1 DUF4231 domain-containing protein [Chryseobacterium sp.]